MLHEKNSSELNQLNDLILPALFKALSDNAEEVVLVDLQVISRICLDSSQFIFVLTSLIQVFEEDRNLLESRGTLIIRRLCGNLDCILIYQTLAEILLSKKDVEFISVVVQILNLILLTAPELAPLRAYLQRSGSGEKIESTATAGKGLCHRRGGGGKEDGHLSLF